MFMKRIPMMIVLGMLSACASSHSASETYVDSVGNRTRIETDREQCIRSCNASDSTCMDSYAARNTGVNGPSGMFGASAECRNNLKDCLSSCKGR